MVSSKYADTYSSKPIFESMRLCLVELSETRWESCWRGWWRPAPFSGDMSGLLTPWFPLPPLALPTLSSERSSSWSSCTTNSSDLSSYCTGAWAPPPPPDPTISASLADPISCRLSSFSDMLFMYTQFKKYLLMLIEFLKFRIRIGFLKIKFFF